MVTLDQPTIKIVAQHLSLIGNTRRLAIIQLLGAHDEGLSVSEIQEQLNMPQPTVSNSLAALRVVGMVECQEQGHNHIYLLVRESVLVAVAMKILEMLVK